MTLISMGHTIKRKSMMKILNPQRGDESIQENKTHQQPQSVPILHSNNPEEVQEVFLKYGLYPRGRKETRKKENDTVKRPYTRARSRSI